MLTVFWNSQGILLTHFQKRGENMNSASYCEFLLKLRDAIRRKLLGQLVRGVLLHQGNVRPHTTRATQERSQELHWKILEHPLYSSDLAPYDFHLFGPLNNQLGEPGYLIRYSDWLQAVRSSVQSSSRGRGKNFLFSTFQTGCGAHPASYPRGTGALSLGVKQPDREADHSPPTITEVKKTWIYT
jgi:hypothetical protein